MLVCSPSLLLKDESSLSEKGSGGGLGVALGYSSMLCPVLGMGSPVVLGRGILVAPHAIFASIGLRGTSGSSVLVCVGFGGA